MIRTTLIAVAILAVTPLAGCEFSYPWGSQMPSLDDAFNDQSCGRTLTGEIDWYEIDAADLPTLWTDLCKTSWNVTGTLVTDYDDINCVSCRCEYTSTMVLGDDGCSWYDGATEFEVTVAFAPTASGPNDHVDEAAEWPWLGYMDIEPDWNNGVPEPSGSTSLVYLGQDSEDALSASFDAAEIYLSSISYVFAENGTDYVDNYARFGMSH